MKYLFGPVPSRRYGRSLGVDLSILKTCTLNCRFCQLGDTQQLTLDRTDQPPIEAVLGELRHWLTRQEPLDYITASGSGEPTLHLHFGDLFRFVRSETAFRSLLLSNGSLFTLPEVRREAALADVVKVSLNAWDQASFEALVRPHPALRFDAILEGFCAFRQIFSGRLDVEVFVVPGMNDTVAQIDRIAALAKRFSPDDISLNTAVRPTADRTLTACSSEQLAHLATRFSCPAQASGPQNTTLPPNMTQEEREALHLRHPLKPENGSAQ
jgi:wyosine [tRNA(Phe)-imidazoG37] synthetase (radical SAM superfamily)